MPADRSDAACTVAGVRKPSMNSEVVRFGVATLIRASGLRRSLISTGPKIEIAAPYSDPDLVCRKKLVPRQGYFLWFTVWSAAMIIERLSAILEREGFRPRRPPRLRGYSRGYQLFRSLPGSVSPSPGRPGLCQAKNARSGCGCKGR
jgi:hypothetical protein